MRLMIEIWTRQSPKKHIYQLPIRQRGLDSSSQISPLLSIVLKTFTCTHRHTLKLSTSGSKVGIILILPVESSSKVLPVLDISSFQLIKPFKLSPWQTILKEIYPQLFISSVWMDFSDVRAEMELWTGYSIILSENRSFKLMRDHHPRC